MTRIPTAALALLVLAPALSAQEPDHPGRTLHWREIDVSARLDADGRLHVAERQTMVFDGEWNGGERSFRLETGQRIRLHGVTRFDPATGAGTPLVQGDLTAVDEISWADRSTLRWRSRLPGDPPFRNHEMIYELVYEVWPVLAQAADGEWRMRHDFLFADRDGVLEHFDLELEIDPAWAGADAPIVRRSASQVEPGRGYTLDLGVRYVGAGAPSAVPRPAPKLVRASVAAGALLLPLVLVAGLRRRERELDRVAPATPPAEVDEGWLDGHIFRYPAEVVGASWDRAVGEAEVAALLARLVAEGRLSSRIEPGDGKEPVLHLERIAPFSDFAAHERDLLEALFFDGRDATDTAAIRGHYETSGFDPAAKIRPAVLASLAELPGTGRVRRRWGSGASLLAAGVIVTILGPRSTGQAPLIAAGLVVVLVAALFALAFAVMLSRRVAHRAGPAAGVVVSVTAAGALLALLAAGAFTGGGALLFVHPDAWLLAGLLLALAGVARLAVDLSAPTDTPERLAFRRRLASARDYFQAELERPDPRLQDRWFPYLLAFGLGPHVDRWFTAFGGATSHAATGAAITSTAGGRPAGSGSGWTGGGPAFGGGSWGGGGAGGSWGVAAAGMASGVSAPSSGGGGGGGGSTSGGGGGGGW